jgi:hypothetical protein
MKLTNKKIFIFMERYKNYYNKTIPFKEIVLSMIKEDLDNIYSYYKN